MKSWLIKQVKVLGKKLLLQALAYLVTKDNLKKILDWLDKKADETDTEIDDMLVKKLREVLGV